MDRRTFIASTVAALAATKIPGLQASESSKVTRWHSPPGRIALLKEGDLPIKYLCLAEQMLFHDEDPHAKLCLEKGIRPPWGADDLPKYDTDRRSICYSFWNPSSVQWWKWSYPDVTPMPITPMPITPEPFDGRVTLPYVEVSGETEAEVVAKKDKMFVDLLERACTGMNTVKSHGSFEKHGPERFREADEMIGVHGFPAERQVLVNPKFPIEERVRYAWQSSRLAAGRKLLDAEDLDQSIYLSHFCPPDVAYMMSPPEYVGRYLIWEAPKEVRTYEGIVHNVIMAILNDYAVVKIPLSEA